MTQVEVGRGQVEASLDPQRTAGGEARFQVFALEDFVRAAGDEVDGVLVVGHGDLAGAATRNVTRLLKGS